MPITLTASSSSPQTVAIQLVDDAVLEDREYFIVQLFSTDPRVALQHPATATVWIMNDDSNTIIYIYTIIIYIYTIIIYTMHASMFHSIPLQVYPLDSDLQPTLPQRAIASLL